jgi:hypothetical protein
MTRTSPNHCFPEIHLPFALEPNTRPCKTKKPQTVGSACGLKKPDETRGYLSQPLVWIWRLPVVMVTGATSVGWAGSALINKRLAPVVQSVTLR